MQKQNFVLEFINREGWKRIIVYLILLVFFLKYCFGYANGFLRDYYTKDIEVKYLQELITAENELQAVQAQLEFKAESQKSEVIKQTGKFEASRQRQQLNAEKLKVYEKSGIYIDKSIDSTVSDIDRLRAKLEAERKKRQRNKSTGIRESV